jgi:hypothetical protein
VLLAMAIAGASLIVTAAIDYDPMGWIVYAREVFGHGVLDTNTYPSWKPLPVLLIGPFSLFAKGFADVYWWLWICRTCGILAVFGSAAIGYQLAGKWAALTVGMVTLLSVWWFEDTMIGRDGPPCAALIVIAILGYTRGWRRFPGLCLVGVALLRPEMTPFVILYGAWEWHQKRLTWYEVVLAVVFIGVMWELPSLLHSGKSPGSLAASGGVAGTPITSNVPFLAVLKGTVTEMREAPAVFCLIGLASTLWGFTRRGRESTFASVFGSNNFERVLVGFAVCWTLIIACETQFLHFSGNNRYQIPGLIVWCVVAGVSAVRLGSLVRRPWGVPLLVALILVPTLARAFWVEKTSYHLVKQRQGQLDQINAELKQQNCPGYAWTDASNNAYLAVITGQSLPASIVPAGVPRRNTRSGSYYFVYCAPAGWKPTGRA